VVHDHTSVLRFIEERFRLAPLSNRDAVANPMLEFFDFQNPPFGTLPNLGPSPATTPCQEEKLRPTVLTETVAPMC
jgi:phospholipase C